ncbi:MULTISPECIES: LexA family protein [Pseudoalteromonas]|uniref:DNA repair protein n=2 Tax=Pseudoalteromonas luteoviolacea TaxID=43657 RepID=A0A162BM81_9GAMM|nr:MULTISPECIES: translesion error-prone DNA polymerase V autoproteolytic subunit [Pseudoalteromonas]KZN49985.1 DNA repair protein [Pseudoalteromonas luteoviolacea H33]KZN64224.1 DNA repair protein [Pseudoalteromonas luteoviolacea CPMOR-1]KZN76258.1 DNA repair protein [Pseudoalteromonas luteoviolacea H33-S]MDK1289869.1 translesion error-prone DNA polymerase V autoproteolytic subunit [Pseudoalteromonas sp. B95]
MKVIPIKAQAGITGFESPAAEYKELGLSLDQLLVNHPNATFIGLASGDSMQGVGIFDGDLLLVDRAVSPQQNDVIVANFNNEFVCKLLDLQNRVLRSASTLYAPVKISECDQFQLEGVVTGSIRMHRTNPGLTRCMR